MQRCSIRFVGKVQGVGFRITTKSVALDLDLVGWVRNEPDGSVLMELQGNSMSIQDCLGRIERETYGRVQSRDEAQIAVVTDETGFEIRR